MKNVISVALLFAAACGGSPPLTVPEDFVVLDEDYADYEMRATNAHGAVMAVREIDNDVEGSLAFWVDAVKNKLRTQGGYALLDASDVTVGSGHVGHQLRFGRDENSQAYQYWVTLIVTPDTVWIVEAGGRGEVFQEAQERIERSITTLQID